MNFKPLPINKIIVYSLNTFIVLLAFTGILIASGETTAQKNTSVKETQIDVYFQDDNLTTVFEKITQKTGFEFVYNKKELKDKVRFNHEYKGQTLYEVLLDISEKANLQFRQINKNINVQSKLEGEDPANPVQILEEVDISGKITDENGEGLPGASVVVKGTTIGTTTDLDGNYKLTVSEQSVLTISFVGYKTSEITVVNQSIIDVQMELDAEQLQEVVVIGYGTQKKSDVTGSVVSMDSKALERQPATNITELMRGALPGLNVGISTSAKGSSGLEIRGPTSLGTSNSPLIVMDDVIFQGDIADINPADVKTVDILKDASAAAIYGSRAAAGVVIITTKTGTEGKPTINIKSSMGFAQVGKTQEVYSPQGYLDYRRDVLDRFDINSPSGYYSNPSNLPSGVTVDDWLGYDDLQGTSTPVEDIWLGRLQLQQVEIDNYKAGNTLDWKDILFQTGFRTNNTISLSGKSNSISYYTSLGYVKNEGIQLYQKYESLRARINLEAKVNNFLSVGFNLQASGTKEPKGIPNSTSLYDKNSPFGSLYYADGTYKHEPHDDALGGNPFIHEYKDNFFRSREAFSNIFGKINLPLGITYRINWSNRYLMDQDYRFVYATATQGAGGDRGSRSDDLYHRWMVDNILKWNKTFAGTHNIDLTFLYNVEEALSWQSSQSNADFDPNDALSYHNLSIGANPIIGSNDSRSTGDAFMARLNYGLLDRYLLTLSVRRDGYSAFGQKNPRATFPAVAFAWRISEEPFLANNQWLSNLKLRLSWGRNGNREIGQYAALSRMGTTRYIYDHSSVTGVYTTNLANQELKWEKTTSYNVGIDYGIIKGRISGSVDAYYMSTTDLLLERSLPDITGYNSVFANLGEVQNKGFELALNTVNVDRTGFSWRTSMSFWMNRNTIKHLYGDIVDVLDDEGNVIGQKEEDDVQNNWYIGHAIDQIFDYKILGIWQLGEEAEAAEFGRAPGDIKIWDRNEDGVLNFDDKVFQGNTKPKYRLSIRNDFTIKNFDASFLINSYLDYYGVNNEHFNSRVGQERLNKVATPYWTAENPSNEWARLQSVNSSPATNWYENKTFFRLQNLTVGYTVPEQMLDKLEVKRLRIYANIQNLPAISGWQYRWDVETSNPTPVIYTLGIDLSL